MLLSPFVSLAQAAPAAAEKINTPLLLLAASAIVGLVVLIARFKCNAFVALLLASLAVGAGSGLPLMSVVTEFQGGVGRTLGFLGMIIGLGTILGKLLGESGAAGVIAGTMVRMMGQKRLDYAIMIVCFLVGISVFFNVGILLLGPIVFSLAKETRTPILRLALPMAAGLSVAHGLIPPHPGPMVAIEKLGANTGLTILWSLILGLPTALITGPLLARWVTPRVPVAIGGIGALASSGSDAPRRPSFAISLFTMLLPVLLMLIATVADVRLPNKAAVEKMKAAAAAAQQVTAAPTQPGVESLPPVSAPPTAEQIAHAQRMASIREVADFLGAPTVAMLIAVLVSFVTFGSMVGFSGARILKFTEECVAPAASIFLVVGAGGGFSAILNASGVGEAIAQLAGKTPVPVIILGWMIAGMLRIAVGSATVAITTAAGLMFPIVQANPGVNKELLVLAMGAGSLIMSHVNDSGFWFVKEYLGMTIEQTLKTWTVVETGIAVTSLILILIADVFV